MMTPTLADILQLSVAERIQLVEDIWDSILATPEKLPVTEAQRHAFPRFIHRGFLDGGDLTTRQITLFLTSPGHAPA